MRSWLWRGLVVTALAVTATAGVFVVYVHRYVAGDRILPGVVVAGLPVGGLTREEAMARLRAAGREALPVTGARQRSIRLRVGEMAWELSAGPKEPPPDVEETVERALAVGRTGGWLDRLSTFARVSLYGYRLPLVPGRPEPVDLTPELEGIAASVYREPVQFRWDPATGKWHGGQAGRRLDVAGTALAIQAALAAGEAEVEAAIREVPPDLPAAAVRHTVASFETPILQADPGRLHNIRMAAARISGVLVRPGEVFSFNRVVGPRSRELGWQPARELYQGEYVMGYGGGICQVSSTLYNAVLLAGLKVIERHHHSRPLSYVPLGQDATVAWDYLDFKFQNTGPGPVVIAAGVRGENPRTIVVTLYGTWQAPAATLESVKEQYVPPDYEEVPDPGLPAGARVIADTGWEGYRVKVYRISGGQRELVGGAFYQPRNGKVRVGTGGVGNQK